MVIAEYNLKIVYILGYPHERNAAGFHQIDLMDHKFKTVSTQEEKNFNRCMNTVHNNICHLQLPSIYPY